MRIILFLGLLVAFTYASVHFGIGRLPGDVVVDRGNGFYFYAPFTTAIIVSILLSLVFWLFRRR